MNILENYTLKIIINLLLIPTFLLLLNTYLKRREKNNSSENKILRYLLEITFIFIILTDFKIHLSLRLYLGIPKFVTYSFLLLLFGLYLNSLHHKIKSTKFIIITIVFLFWIMMWIIDLKLIVISIYNFSDELLEDLFHFFSMLTWCLLILYILFKKNVRLHL